MGRVVKPLVIVEIVFLVLAFAAGLTVIIPLLQSQDQFPNVKCLPYASVDYRHNPIHTWLDVKVTPPDSNGTCNYCLFAQIAVAVAALVCVTYRLVTVFAEKVDLAFLRTLSVPLYALSALCVLVEGIILQVGVNMFLGMVMTLQSSAGVEFKTCALAQARLQTAADSSSTADVGQLNFCSEFQIATVASWVSMVIWLTLTALAGVQFYLQGKSPESDRQMLVVGAETDTKSMST